jgi:uridylate kinase
MKVAISLGGSLLTGKSNDDYVKLDPHRFTRYADVINDLHAEGHQLIVVCGGGKPARYFMDTAKTMGASAEVLDYLGIKSSHINALIFMAALGYVAEQPTVYETPGEPFDGREPGKVWIGGGHKPGTSTDYRTVQFAEAMEADLVINATDIDGVYTKNPKTNPDAEKISELTFETLEKIIVENTRQAPGEYGLFDLAAVELSKKIKIPVAIIDGTDPQEIARAVHGKHTGSTIR